MPRNREPLLPIALLAALLATAGASALPRSGAAEITGRAVDEDGAPVPGAVVTLHPVVSGAERGALWLAGRAHPEPVARTRAGEDGLFRIDAPDADPPFWTVVVGAEGRVPVEHEVGPLFDSVDLPPAVLPQSAPAAVRVVDAEGRPVAGMPVLHSVTPSSFGFRFLQGPWAPSPFRVARTGPDGRVSVPRQAGETGEIVVPAPGRFTRAELSGARIRVVLPASGGPGARVLRVLGPGGSPEPGAVVWGPVVGLPRNVRVNPRMGRVPLGVTGEDGEAVVSAGALAGEGDDEAPGLYVETPDGLWAEVPVGPAGPEEAGEPLVARLAAPPSARGTVREPAGDPVSDAVVWVPGDAAGAVRTGDTGGFALELPAAVERSVVQAVGPRHRQAVREGVEGTGPPSGIELFLSPSTRFTGRVEDGAGRAVEGAVVEASPDHRSMMGMMSYCGRGRARSRADGSFRIPGVSASCAYTVSAEREGYAPGSVEVPPSPDGAEPESRPLLLVLSAGHRLTGRVVDDSGAPVPGARVVFAPDQGRDGSMPRELPESVSGTDGYFSLAHLPPSTGDLHVEAPGFALLERPGIQIPIQAPDTPGATDLGDIAMEPEAVLEVRVEDPSGDAVAGARVDAGTPRSPMSWQDVRRQATQEGPPEPLTDESGIFRAGGFRAGDRTRVVVSREGYAPESLFGVRVPDDSPLRVVLRPGAVVSGRVVDGAGRPVSEAHVAVEGDGSETAFGMSRGGEVDEEGRFELRDLPAGPLTLRAFGEDQRRSAGVLVELEGGEHRRNVELVLQARPKIVVRVVAPDGDLPRRLMVFASTASLGTSCNGPVDGLYTCDGSSGPGTYSISARAPGVGAGEVEVELGETDVAVDLHLEPEQEVSGRVVTADGEPAASLRVRLHPVEPDLIMSLSAMTTADGSFAARGSLEGEYHLMIDREVGGRGSTPPYLHPETIVVAAGESITGLLIRLESITVVRGRLLGVDPGELGEVRVSARVTAREGWQPFAAGTVLDGGRYEVRLTPGTWRIMAAEARGGRRGEAEVTVAGEAERVVDLDLSPALAVSGVVRIGGEPWAGATVSSTTSGFASAVTDLQGRFELHGLDPGRQELIVRDRNHRLAVRHEVVVGEEREVVLDVRVGRVRGTVLSSIGVEPIADAEIRLAGAEADRLTPVPAAPTTADGRFLIDRVPVGTYLLTIEKAGHLPFTTELHVTGGELELPPVVLEPEAP